MHCIPWVTNPPNYRRLRQVRSRRRTCHSGTPVLQQQLSGIERTCPPPSRTTAGCHNRNYLEPDHCSVGSNSRKEAGAQQVATRPVHGSQFRRLADTRCFKADTLGPGRKLRGSMPPSNRNDSPQHLQWRSPPDGYLVSLPMSQSIAKSDAKPAPSRDAAPDGIHRTLTDCLSQWQNQTTASTTLLGHWIVDAN
jgi:hypothetical protein